MSSLLALVLLSAPPAVGDQAANFSLKSIGGESISLADVTKKQTAVVVVLRGYPGYQCRLCSRQFGQFVSRAKDFEAANANLVFVYPADESLGEEGTRAKAKEFLKNAQLPANVKVVLDPGYQFTEAYDIRWDGANETAFPSTFVIDSSGKVTAATVSKSHGGRTDVATVLADAKRAGS